MTGEESRQLARETNDAEAAAGVIPRYIEDPVVLRRVARLLLPVLGRQVEQQGGAGDHAA